MGVPKLLQKLQQEYQAADTTLQSNVDQVQTNLDNTPKKWGLETLVDTRSTTGANFTLSGGPYAEDRIVMARFRGESPDENGLFRIEGRISNNVVAESFGAGHINANFFPGGGCGVTFLCPAGETWQVLRVNVNSSIAISGEVHTCAFIP